jgi:peptidoglycan/LPS O-acetylase OafA/YrhL
VTADTLIAPGLVTGIAVAGAPVDNRTMIWPVAALAVFVLGFIVVYGSLLQSRLKAGWDRHDAGLAREDIAR